MMHGFGEKLKSEWPRRERTGSTSAARAYYERAIPSTSTMRMVPEGGGCSTARTIAPNNLVECYETQASRAFAPRRHQLGDGVERHEQQRPSMPRPDHVPRTKHGRSQTRVGDRLFAGGSSGDICRHDGRRLSDADVNEVRDASLSRCRRRGLRRREIDTQEFGCLRRARMRRADQVHQRVGGSQRGDVRAGVERIADERHGPAGTRSADCARARARTRCPRASSAGMRRVPM